MVARRKFSSQRKKPLYTKSTAMDVNVTQSSNSVSGDKTSTPEAPSSPNDSIVEIHRLMTENPPVVPQPEPIPITPGGSSEAPQSVPVPSIPPSSQVVTRLPFGTFKAIPPSFNFGTPPATYNFNFKQSPRPFRPFNLKSTASSGSPKLGLNDTIDLSQDSPAPLIDLEPDEMEEGEITEMTLADISDTTLPLGSPNPPPEVHTSSWRERPNSTSPQPPPPPRISPVSTNPIVPITEIILGSDDEDDIEVVGIVSPGNSSMVGGGRARGAVRLRLSRKSLKRARVGSSSSRAGTPLGAQRGANQVIGSPVRKNPNARGGSRAVKSGRIQKKMTHRMRGQTRWGTPLPISKQQRRKSLRLATATVTDLATGTGFNRKLNTMNKFSPYLKRLENINPTNSNRALVKQKQRYFNQPSGSLLGLGQPNLSGGNAPMIVWNPINRNGGNLPFHQQQQRLLPSPPPVRRNPLGSPRPIVIDGSNVAVGHGGPSKQFSCRGLDIMVQKIKLELPHKEIVVFVPRFRAKLSESIDTYILDNLEKDGILKYTPSRDVGNKRISSYDDRFIVEYAVKTGGIIVSNDNFRDLYKDEPEWRDTISNRLLQFTWVNDLLMFPADPLGKDGPKLDEFLCFPAQATMNF